MVMPPAQPPQVNRQLAMVFDLNKCLGCQTCTIACKTLWTDEEGTEYMYWTITSTFPGRGHPRDWQESGGGFDAEGNAKPGKLPTQKDFGEAWEFNYQNVFFGGNGESAYLRPLTANGSEPTWGALWDEDQGTGDYPNNFYFYLPYICMHCTRPACLEACPRHAIYKRVEDGIVLVDQDRCHGYRYCTEACPYKRVFFNSKQKVSQKCIFCYPRIEQGVAPACARQCPGRLRHIGYLDDTESSVCKLVNKWKVALPLHPEFGTGPNVYYVPPLAPTAFDSTGNWDDLKPRIPTEYLRSLFGPEVDRALETLKAEMEKAQKGMRSELMDLLIVYRWPEDIFRPFTKNPSTMERPQNRNARQWGKARLGTQ